MVIALVGNKTDLESRRTVSTEEGQKFARENNLIFIETSAKNDNNVEEAFENASRTIFIKIAEGSINIHSETCGVRIGPSVPSTSRGEIPRQKNDCC